MTKLIINHCFHPVGQGLFASGSICLDRRSSLAYRSTGAGAAAIPNPQFRWVYDCGTRRGTQSLTRSIKDLANRWRGEKIDLLTLSHFHSDHISGVLRLLKVLNARTVMLPWAPLWQRLALGFAQGLRADDPLLGFYVDPTTFLSEAVLDRFQSILFVMPSAGPGPAIEAEPTSGPDETPDREESAADQTWGEPANPGDLELSDHGRGDIRKLGQGEKISLNWWWEFIPYNEPATSPTDPAGFRAIVSVYREMLLNGDKVARKHALRDLRRFYEATFPGHSAMNDVSLALYGGALGKWEGQIYCDCKCIWGLIGGTCHCWKAQESRGAILLTGDGDLSSAAKWASMETYLNPSRARRTSVFQVAHHGARSNWHKGLAALAAPVASVFSSDPGHKDGHPHAEVLRDFWPFYPIQVDRHVGFSTRVVLEL